eukprot:GHVH01012234.1.p1 GENE.GHVH01012234.1~~GHVH01012234.1.p1  ORF type:complete len:395 (+),score=54.82 GHVH01012234.1:127-1311(+)
MSREKEGHCPFGTSPAVMQNVLKPYKEFKCKSENELSDFQRDWKVPEKDTTSADYYFNSYEHHSIHEDMLKDKVRTTAYQRAIQSNPWLFKDKVVIDVGAGTGILSMFAARAGAKKVIAIECSRIAEMGRALVDLNGFADVITFVQLKAEEASDAIQSIGEELGFSKGEKFVDCIVSEWMGYFLLYESMFDSVIHIRDLYLKPEGLLFPDKATLHVAGIEDSQYKNQCLQFWDSVYGFDFKPMQKFMYEEPVVDFVDQESICTDSCSILELDLKTCSIGDLDFASDYELTFQRNDTCHAVMAWFDTGFTACHRPVVLSTSPYGTQTHWKQTTFYTKTEIVGSAGESITGTVAVRKNGKNPRDLDVKLNYIFNGKRGRSTDTTKPVNETQFFRIC